MSPEISIQGIEPKPSYDFFKITEPDGARLEVARQLMICSNAPAALIIYLTLAHAGSRISMMHLGTLYRRGEDVGRDLKEAEHWYSKAADLGFIPANYGLALTHLKQGYYRKATLQFEVAAKGGYVPAIYMLGEMLFRGQGTTQNIEGARQLWELTNAKGYLPGKRALGNLLMSGYFGVTPGFRGIWLRLEAAVLRPYLQRKNRWDERLG